jgi:hypothetical protein
MQPADDAQSSSSRSSKNSKNSKNSKTSVNPTTSARAKGTAAHQRSSRMTFARYHPA